MPDGVSEHCTLCFVNMYLFTPFSLCFDDLVKGVLLKLYRCF